MNVNESKVVWHGGSVACTAASQQEGHGFDSHMGRCWLWGAGPPQSAQCSSGLSLGPFCVEFACSPRVHKGFPPLKTPTEKTCRTEHSLSVPDQDRQFTSLGPRALKSCPLLLWSWRKDSPGWENSQTTSGVRVCVDCIFPIPDLTAEQEV